MITPPLISAELARERREAHQRETRRPGRPRAARALAPVLAATLAAGLLALTTAGVRIGAASPGPPALAATCPWLDGVSAAGGEPERLLFTLCAHERGGAARRGAS